MYVENRLQRIYLRRPYNISDEFDEKYVAWFSYSFQSFLFMLYNMYGGYQPGKIRRSCPSVLYLGANFYYYYYY